MSGKIKANEATKSHAKKYIFDKGWVISTHWYLKLNIQYIEHYENYLN
jgi:hypothetical protein